jgi:hypothetical protein
VWRGGVCGRRRARRSSRRGAEGCAADDGRGGAHSVARQQMVRCNKAHGMECHTADDVWAANNVFDEMLVWELKWNDSTLQPNVKWNGPTLKI